MPPTLIVSPHNTCPPQDERRVAQSHGAGRQGLGLSLLHGDMAISEATRFLGPVLSTVPTSRDTCPKMPSLGFGAL